MSSARREDRYPLLFVVNVGGDSLEKPPLDPTPSIRDRNVTRGAATLISRWPQHVQSTSHIAFFTAVTILCLSFFLVAVIFYTSDFTLGNGFGFHPRPKQRRPTMCNLDKSLEIIHEAADVATLVKFMTPLPKAWEFLSDEGKIFFVMSQGDTLTPAKQCALLSAAEANPNATIYLLVLVDGVLPQAVPDEEMAAFNGSVSVVYVDATRYLEATPLRGLRQRGEARLLAAKLVTLWRFGGVSLDVGVVSLKAARVPRRNSRSAYVDLEGRVITVRHPCHAFMFQAMSVLDRMRWNGTRQDPPSALDVLTAAQDIYCRKPHCRNRPGNTGKCPGFKFMPREYLCSLQYHHDNSTCIWASVTPLDVNTKHFDEVCSTIPSNSQQNTTLA